MEDEMRIKSVEYLPKNDYLVIFPKNILSKHRKYVIYIPFEGLSSFQKYSGN